MKIQQLKGEPPGGVGGQKWGGEARAQRTAQGGRQAAQAALGSEGCAGVGEQKGARRGLPSGGMCEQEEARMLSVWPRA